MVIAEIIKHPGFELIGVGVGNPEKVGRDVGEICGLGRSLALTATDDVDALIALKPDALVHYGPTAAHADDNIALIARFLRAGIDVCSTSMTPWVWPKMHLNPPNWIQPITDACEAGQSSCFTTGIDPGFANDLFPMTLMGLCSEIRTVRASELLDYTNYEGDYEFEMGIGKPPEHRPLLETPDILVFAWGATVPMIAYAAGIELDGITTTWDKWVTPNERKTAKGIIAPGNVAAVRFTINGIYKGETRIQLEHVNRIGDDAARTGRRATRTTSTGWTSRAPRASSRRPPSGSPTARPRRRRRRLPSNGASRAQRGARSQRPAARLGDPAGAAADRGGRHDSMTWQTG
jgi:4-hydroxy-tetrahydrodipicolinate reductase